MRNLPRHGDGHCQDNDQGAPASEIDLKPSRYAASAKLADQVRGSHIVIVERRGFIGECVARCLEAASGQEVVCHRTLQDWLKVAEEHPAALLIVCMWKEGAAEDMALLSHVTDKQLTIVISDIEDPDRIVRTLEKGVRGYIPTSLSLDVAVEAMRLVRAGGIFVPANSLMAARAPHDGANAPAQVGEMFTARQAAVVHALRRGKPIKAIALELNMRESTVKVHVRNIMKKLSAKNRTEVALKANGIFEGEIDYMARMG